MRANALSCVYILIQGTPGSGRYHNRMRFLACLLAFSLAFLPRAFGQDTSLPRFGRTDPEPQPLVRSAPLPDLGDAGSAELTLATERRIGESIMRDIRRDPSYVEDPEVAEYLNGLGARLTSVAAGARQEFEFFAIRDPSINAFALPGGFIGVNTGLITVSDSESEIASVLSHEIAHVTQRHIARQIGIQKQMQVPMMIAMAAAILLGRSRPDLASGAMAATQGGAISSQLAYSRDFEREADRVGFQTLSASGFDVRAMGEFFEKMQRYTRLQDSGVVPSYLRSHPVTSERISDAQARAEGMPYKQRADTLEYHLVRAKLRAEAGEARDAVRIFTDAVNDRRFANEPGARYGLAVAYLRVKEPKRAEEEIARLRAAKVASPMVVPWRRERAWIRATRPARSRFSRPRCSAIPTAARSSTRHWPRCRSSGATTRCWRRSPSRCGSIRAIQICSRRAPRPMRGRASGCCSTRRWPRSTSCKAACLRRSSSCSSPSLPATAISTNSRRSTRA